MSVENPATPDASTGSLPDPSIVDRSGPEPVAHGAATQAVFNDTHRERTIYRQCYDLRQDLVDDRDDEPVVVAELDADDVEWLTPPACGREYVIVISSSRWKGGTGEGDDYSAWYKYDLTLRERDDDGDLHHDSGKSLSLRVIPQLDVLNYQDGGEITYQYGQGSLVRCSTTWATDAVEIETRMFDVLARVLDDVDRSRLLDDRDHDSRRVQKAEAHHRFDIGWKRQVIDTIDKTRELIAYGGMSEIAASHKRQRAGYLEAVLDADRWHLLGFDRQPFSIELKCYQTAGWDERPRSDPSHHPKIEASFAGVDGEGQLPHVDEWDEIMSTLRTIVSSHLDWAGVGRDELIADDFQDGPAVDEYQYPHPTGRREQLRERFEAVSTQVYREALKANTDAVYDILTVVATESGASYDLLEERTGLARSTIRHHVARLVDVGVVDRLGNPVLVVFPSLAVLEESKDILREIYPDDTVEDMVERAEARRERREERAEERDDLDDRDDDDRDQPADDDDRDQDDGDGRSSEWAYFDELDEIAPDHLASALERDIIASDHVRVRTDPYTWLG